MLKDITMEMFFHYYPFLEEEEPPSDPQIELVVFGIWLRIDRPITQFSLEKYIVEIEQQLMKLGRLGWKAFNETTGKPDGVGIGSVKGHPVGSQIMAYLKSVADNDSDISTEELHRAMQSRKLQKEMCAWLNERELQRITDRIHELERELDHPFGIGRNKFNIACQSIFKGWFLSKDLPAPQIDEPRGKTTFVPKPKRELIKSQYEQLFNKYYSDPNADPEEVKRVLNDKERWRNPSEYLRQNKKRKGITTADLKKRPGFDWIDPKGTAKD